jgi:hypothetical protein
VRIWSWPTGFVSLRFADRLAPTLAEHIRDWRLVLGVERVGIDQARCLRRGVLPLDADLRGLAVEGGGDVNEGRKMIVGRRMKTDHPGSVSRVGSGSAWRVARGVAGGPRSPSASP